VRYQTGAQTTINNNNTVINEVKDCGPCGDYILGTTHSDLTGDGTIDVVKIVGLLVRFTGAAPPSLVLEGTPPYLWNLGWVSVSNSDGMLDEKRVTRDAMVWFPSGIEHATQIGYTAKAGVVLEVQELWAASSITPSTALHLY
jgi:hypothetical protein